MPASTSRRRRKRARRERNREREVARRAAVHEPLPVRKRIILMHRRRVVFEFDLTDAVRIPWDGETPASVQDVLRERWSRAGHEVVPGEH